MEVAKMKNVIKELEFNLAEGYTFNGCNLNVKVSVTLTGEASNVDRASQKTMASINNSKQPMPLNVCIESLNISPRARGCLERAGILTLEDLIQRNESDLRRIWSFGSKCLEEIKMLLREFGLSLKEF